MKKKYSFYKNCTCYICNKKVYRLKRIISENGLIFVDVALCKKHSKLKDKGLLGIS